jgi:SAM-dependent methyltransferase
MTVDARPARELGSISPTPAPVLDVYAAALAAAPQSLRAQWCDGTAVDLPVQRWLGRATPADESVLDGVVGPVLDVGCGPGRHLAALERRGVQAVGVDVSPMAVGLARARGAVALARSVFDRLPGDGAWGTVLLLDGNVGIGGDPVALLRRVGSLLAPHGRILVELEPPGSPTRTGVVRLSVGERTSSPVAWARVGVDGVAGAAAAAGFATRAVRELDERWFASLSRARPAG